MPADQKVEKIKLLLNEVLNKEKVKEEDAALIYEIWHNFLQVRGAGKLDGLPQGWSAALYYILRNIITGEGKSQQECADPFDIKAGTLSKRYCEIKKYIDLQQYRDKGRKSKKNNKNRKSKKRKNRKKPIEPGYDRARGEAEKLKREVSPLPLDDQSLVLIFKKMKELLELTHQDKEYFEIKRFLKFVDINLTMSGYRIDWPTLKEKFKQLFLQLKMIPVKGRDADKFIHLTDKQGKTEPYVYIQFRR